MTTRINLATRRPSSLVINSDSSDTDDFKTPPAPKFPFYNRSPSSDTTSSECSPDTPENACYGLFSEKHVMHMTRHNDRYKRIYYNKLGTSIKTQITNVVDYSFIKEQNLSVESWVNEYKNIWDDAHYLGLLDNKTFSNC